MKRPLIIAALVLLLSLSANAQNNARNFPGSSSNSLDNSVSYVAGASVFTISAWVKNGSIAQTNTYVIEAYGASHADQVSLIYGYSSHQYQLYTFNQSSGTNPQSISGMTIADTNWHHIAYTYDGTTLNGYVDGANKFSTAIAFVTNTPHSHFYAAESNSGSSNINAAIAQIVITDTALSAGNITSLSNCTDATTLGLGGHLVGYWKLNAGASPELDSSGNGNSLTVTGTTTVSGPPACSGVAAPAGFNKKKKLEKLEVRFEDSDSNGARFVRPDAIGIRFLNPDSAGARSLTPAPIETRESARFAQ